MKSQQPIIKTPLHNADTNMELTAQDLRNRGREDGFHNFQRTAADYERILIDPFEFAGNQAISHTMGSPVSDPRDDPESVDLPAAAGTDWKLCGTGDFNQDGKVDLVWRNVGNGTNAVWFMNGLTRTSVGWLPTAANSDWTLCGTGDFNNDGKVDLVWRNVGNG